MATNQDNIILTMLKAKCFAACWGSKLIDQEKAGEDIDCCEVELFVFIELIQIMDRTYCQYYGTNGNLSPADPNLTQLEMQSLLGKIKKYMA